MAARGKRDDLDSWVLATAARAVAFAASLLRDRGLAEDIVQDCYCRLLQKAEDYDLPRDGVKLLFKAISNACINANTRERFFVSLDEAPGREERARPQVADRTALPPEEEMVYRELKDAVDQGLALLPTMQRAALELKGLGHSQEEIADVLEITASHAAVLIFRARRALAAYLAPFVGETP